MNKVKTVYIGSNWESLEILKAIIKDGRFDIVGIITQSDKPAGRKQILTPTVVKQYGIENHIEVYHTNSDEKRYKEALEIFNPELIVCVAFGEIIPEFFLEYPKYKAINVHFSILPEFRGAVPIQMAILHGHKETGVTFVQMVKDIDAGPILKIIKEEIKDNDTNLSLRERLVEISAKELPSVLCDWIDGKISPIPQDLSQGSIFYKKDIEKKKAEIKFNSMEAEYIERMVRAFIPWPVAWAMINGKRCKIYEVKVATEGYEDKNRLMLKTMSGDIEILKLQPEGKNIMSAAEFLRGNTV